MVDTVDIDLRHVVKTLYTKKFWILGFSILVGAAIFVFLLLSPIKYNATAVVALTDPLYRPNFDPANWETTDNAMDSSIALDIARSQELYDYVFEAWNNAEKQPDMRDDFFQENLSVKSGEDPKVVLLSVRLESREEATRLANFWAGELVKRLDIIASRQNRDQAKYFEVQIVDANNNLETAQNAMIAFEGRNETSSLEAQLNSLRYEQKDYLQRIQLFASLKRNAEALLREVEAIPGDNYVADAKQTRLLVLQLRQYDIVQPEPSLDASSASAIVSPYQYQLPLTTDADPITVAQFRRTIEEWIKSQDEHAAVLQDLLKEYPQKINALQEQIAVLKEEMDQLTLELEVASDMYDSLSRKYQEAKITTKEIVGSASIAAQASATSDTSLLQTLLLSIVGFVGTGVVAATIIMFMDWWRRIIKA